MLKEGIFVQLTKDRGRGVFTRKNIPSDTIIEVSPVIIMTNEDRSHLDKTLLHDYIFEWGEPVTGCAMALGLIPIYNHSYTSNCEYFMLYEDSEICIKTTTKIKAGEELTINYNGESNDKKEVWFKVTE